jgi:hypothetical protein
MPQSSFLFVKFGTKSYHNLDDASLTTFEELGVPYSEAEGWPGYTHHFVLARASGMLCRVSTSPRREVGLMVLLVRWKGLGGQR